MVSTSSPALLRKIGLLSATALVVSNMIGTGIFTGTGFLAAQLGSTQLVFAIYLVGGFCALLGALCYSELAVNIQSSGGEYVYLTQAFGPSWGFMTGWASFFAGFSGPIAAAALAFSEYLSHFFPSLAADQAMIIAGSGQYALRLGGAQAVAASLVILFTILNIFGVERTAKVQNALTGMKVLVLLAFIVLGFAIGTGDTANFASVTTRDDPSVPLAAQFAVSLVWVYLAYSGWNAAVYVAEEIREPARTLPRSLAIGCTLVIALYIVLNLVFFYASPAGEMKNQAAIGSFTASRLFGPAGAGIFAGLMALSLMSTVNAMVTIGPRVYFAMARDGAFPAAAARVHPRFRTPVASILAQGVCTVLMTLTPFPQLVVYIGMTLNFFAVMGVLSILRFRRRPGWRKLPGVSFAYPAVPLLFSAVGLWMTYQGLMLQPYASGGTIATLVTGALVYHFKRRGQPVPLHAPDNPNV